MMSGRSAGIRNDGVMLRRHPILSLATALYLGFVGWMTLAPEPYDERVSGPLDEVLRFFSRDQRTEWITFDLVEFLANIAMFVPVGMFFLLLAGRRWWWAVTLVGTLISTAIELIQIALPTRFPDPQDVLANGLGTLIGALLVIAFAAITVRVKRLSTAER